MMLLRWWFIFFHIISVTYIPVFHFHLLLHNGSLYTAKGLKNLPFLLSVKLAIKMKSLWQPVRSILVSIK